MHYTSLPWQATGPDLQFCVSAFSPTNVDADGCANCSRLLTEPIKTWKTKAFRGLVLTTAPKVLLKPHFPLEFPYAEYLSPERNPISFTA